MLGSSPMPHASSKRDRSALGSLLGALLCALGGGYGGDDSLALGVGAVAPVVASRKPRVRMRHVTHWRGGSVAQAACAHAPRHDTGVVVASRKPRVRMRHVRKLGWW